MKALSIHPYYADLIFAEIKKIEVRTWKTDYRGELLICTTQRKFKGTIPGHGLCTVQLKDVVPLEKKHLRDACLDKLPDVKSYAWILEDVKIIRPIPLKGKLGLWNYDGEVEYLEEPEDEEEDERMYHEIWEPLEV